MNADRGIVDPIFLVLGMMVVLFVATVVFAIATSPV